MVMVKAMVIADHKIKNTKAVIDRIIWFILFGLKGQVVMASNKVLQKETKFGVRSTNGCSIAKPLLDTYRLCKSVPECLARASDRNI